MSPEQFFQELLCKLYALEYFYKTAHWTVSRSIYYGDHLLFDRLSEEAGERTDQVAEKAIGVTGNISIVNLPAVLKRVYAIITPLSYENTENSKYFEDGLKLEQSLLEFCKSNSQTAPSFGTQNMLQDIADEAEGRVYLIKQRLKK